MKLKESFKKLFSEEVDDQFSIQLKAIIAHFEYSIEDINSYEELTKKEKSIISKEIFDDICDQFSWLERYPVMVEVKDSTPASDAN